MPFVRVATAAKKKFLLKQLLILAPLSMSGIYLATQAVRSISSSMIRNSNVSTAQTTQVVSQTGTSRTAMRTANPADRIANPPPPATGPGSTPGDPFGGGNPGGAPAGAVPVDGGITLLLAAGLGYGARKAYQNRSTQKESQEI